MIRNSVLTRCKAALTSHYGPRFRGLVVFGSSARGQATAGSDLDMLVLMAEPFDYVRELREIIDLLYPIQLDCEQLISAKPASQQDFESGTVQLYRNAKREGVLV
jgi:predicted nucleotidyltransferase